jgi:hypothetical protein
VRDGEERRARVDARAGHPRRTPGSCSPRACWCPVLVRIGAFWRLPPHRLRHAHAVELAHEGGPLVVIPAPTRGTPTPGSQASICRALTTPKSPTPSSHRPRQSYPPAPACARREGQNPPDDRFAAGAILLAPAAAGRDSVDSDRPDGVKRTLASGRMRSSAAARIRHGVGEGFVANPVAGDGPGRGRMRSSAPAGFLRGRNFGTSPERVRAFVLERHTDAGTDRAVRAHAS